jgi:hypothetical protein
MAILLSVEESKTQFCTIVGVVKAVDGASLFINEREIVSVVAINSELEGVEGRLAKLYNALEKGEFKGGELAPRIKSLFEKKTELEQSKSGAEDALKYRTIELPGPGVVKGYVQDLKTLLEESTIISKKAFLRSFIERIDVDEEEVKVIYTMPVPPESPPAETVGVLPFLHDSPPSSHPFPSKIPGGKPRQFDCAVDFEI